MNKDMENTFNRMAELGGSDERLGTNTTPVINAPIIPKNTRRAAQALEENPAAYLRQKDIDRLSSCHPGAINVQISNTPFMAFTVPVFAALSSQPVADGFKTEREQALEKALKPFSDIAGELFAMNYNENDVVFTVHRKTPKGSKISTSMTFKAFNNARAALPASPGASE